MDESAAQAVRPLSTLASANNAAMAELGRGANVSSQQQRSEVTEESLISRAECFGSGSPKTAAHNASVQRVWRERTQTLDSKQRRTPAAAAS